MRSHGEVVVPVLHEPFGRHIRGGRSPPSDRRRFGEVAQPLVDGERFSQLFKARSFGRRSIVEILHTQGDFRQAADVRLQIDATVVRDNTRV